LGHVIFCIGLTADFRKSPFETIEAHVQVLANVLKRAQFDSFLYLSSTRVYEGASSTKEETPLVVNPFNLNHIFNLSKLAGEALCLSLNSPKIKIVRVSNVLGDDFKSENFVFSVMKELIQTAQVILKTTPSSAKDYILIDDVVEMLPIIAVRGQSRVYNLARGKNITNEEVLKKLTGAKVSYARDASEIIFPEIAVTKLKEEFNFAPGDPLKEIEAIYSRFRKYLSA